MADEPHAVVRLLLARVESHPEEFKHGGYRWRNIIDQVTEFGLDIDRGAINDALRTVRMAKAHEEMMDELLNGEDRRRKEEEARQYEMSLRNIQTQSALGNLQQHQSALGNYTSQLQSTQQHMQGAVNNSTSIVLTDVIKKALGL